MDFKSNINKIHYQLSEVFDDIKIEEKYSSELGNYIQLSINEKLKCDIIISKKELQNDVINWKYNSNPIKENSTWVERSCKVSEFSNVVDEIIKKKRFDSDYLKNI